MSLDINDEVAALQRLTIRQLLVRYAELFGDQVRTLNKPWLIKRIAWRLQALAEGGLSERARQRAAELANEADLRVLPPRPAMTPAPSTTAGSTMANETPLPAP